jgi:hypothetical protein
MAAAEKQRLYRARQATAKGLEPGRVGNHPLLYAQEEALLVEKLLTWPDFMHYPTRADIPELVLPFTLSIRFL